MRGLGIQEALTATSLFSCASAGGNYDRLRYVSDDRRAIIRERAVARQVAIRQTGQCGSSQDEGESEDEAEGPHLTVSGFARRRYPPFCWRVDNHPPFPEFCFEADNGFVADENCFVATGGRNNSAKSGREPWWFIGLAAVVQWPIAAMICGAGIGDPQ
jgi:hypothetical protein